MDESEGPAPEPRWYVAQASAPAKCTSEGVIEARDELVVTSPSPAAFPSRGLSVVPGSQSRLRYVGSISEPPDAPSNIGRSREAGQPGSGRATSIRCTLCKKDVCRLARVVG